MTIPESPSPLPPADPAAQAAPPAAEPIVAAAPAASAESTLSAPELQAPAFQASDYPPPAVGFYPAGVIAAPPVVKRKRPVMLIVTIILLSLMLIGAVVAIVLYYLELEDANSRIDDQNEQIQQQEDLIDKKETFGAAMEKLLDTASTFEATLYGDIVPVSSYQLTASREWAHRWDGEDIDDDIAQVGEYTDELQAIIDAAAIEASTNTTGSVYETTVDALGLGYVSSLLYDADTFCESDVIACVAGEDPYTVHFDTADNNVPYTNDFIRQGVSYHEFAHVLQFTNPELTETAVASFGGDNETMADCFALTYLPGWALHQRVYVSSYSWWEVDIGYGYTCNESQRQVVRDWYDQLGYKAEPISQED